MVLVYVDDIIISGTEMDMIQHLRVSLQDSFHMKDLCHLKYFLGLEAHQSEKGLIPNQHKYAIDLIDVASLQNYTLVDIPLQVMSNSVKTQEIFQI